ncbi:MAG TPA: FHA domain-containing protein [Solirubrobacteraceae bacterium]
MTDRPKIILSEDDFADQPAAPAATAPLQPHAPAPSPGAAGLPGITPRAPLHVDPSTGGHAAPQPSPVARPVTLPPSVERWVDDPRYGFLIAAALGMLLGWAFLEVTGIADGIPESESALHRQAGVYVGIVAVAFTGVVLSFDRAVHGAWDVAGRRFATAVIPAFVVGFVSGYLASVIYLEIVQSIIEDAFGDESFELSDHDARFYLARVLAWGIFGAGVGAAIGLVDRSKRRAVNGALGGAIGGAAGGLFFQLSAAEVGSEALSRILGLLAIGVLITFATRAVETARREAWLSIVAGGMTGTEFILYHEVTRIGSSPDCEIFLLKDPAVAKLHAHIHDRGADRVISAAQGAAVLINGTPVASHVLRAGDVIQIGHTSIAYAERATATASVAGYPAGA